MYIARKSIECSVAGKRFMVPEEIRNRNSRPAGVFTTVKKNGLLRGCIGFIYPTYPVWEAVQKSAILSVTEDPRFPPVQSGEVAELGIEITVLGTLERLDLLQGSGLKEVSIGKDGLYITDGIRSGLLLPQVATENNLDEREFIIETAYKAGIDPGDVFSGNADIYRFPAVIIEDNPLP